ncbi:MAG: L,D-transpeptidase [Paracoccaceae bacterium]
MPDRRSFLCSAVALAALSARPAWALDSGAAAASAAAPTAADLAAPLDPATLGSAEAPLPGLTIAPELYPVEVTVRRDLVPGTIIVLSQQHYLYLITRKGIAIRYGVAVGKKELVFRGEAVVGRKAEWPRWKPTPEMVERHPEAYARYADDGMDGGPKNPLGARAIYLFQNGHDTAVRIHGTIEPNSIGKSVSNGCIRMVNAHVVDLYRRVGIGTGVSVF